jgi:hypothetical protein
MTHSIPRGIRNNNPGNIRIGDKWQGLADHFEMNDAQRAETSFGVFRRPWYGVRAMARLLLNYQQNYRLSTISAIISRWAPSSENDTGSYARAVARAAGKDVDEFIDMRQYETAHAVISAMIKHENGENPYTDEVRIGLILAGIDPGSDIHAVRH